MKNSEKTSVPHLKFTGCETSTPGFAFKKCMIFVWLRHEQPHVRTYSGAYRYITSLVFHFLQGGGIYSIPSAPRLISRNLPRVKSTTSNLSNAPSTIPIAHAQLSISTPKQASSEQKMLKNEKFRKFHFQPTVAVYIPAQTGLVRAKKC